MNDHDELRSIPARLTTGCAFALLFAAGVTNAIELSPGDIIAADNFSDNVYVVDPTTGIATELSGLGVGAGPRARWTFRRLS